MEYFTLFCRDKKIVYLATLTELYYIKIIFENRVFCSICDTTWVLRFQKGILIKYTTYKYIQFSGLWKSFFVNIIWSYSVAMMVDHCNLKLLLFQTCSLVLLCPHLLMSSVMFNLFLFSSHFPACCFLKRL